MDSLPYIEKEGSSDLTMISYNFTMSEMNGHNCFTPPHNVQTDSTWHHSYVTQ